MIPIDDTISQKENHTVKYRFNICSKVILHKRGNRFTIAFFTIKTFTSTSRLLKKTDWVSNTNFYTVF